MRFKISAAAISVIAGGLVWMTAEDARTSDAGQSFDRGAWVANAGVFDHTNTRSEQLGAAAARIDEGMSKQDVLRELGQPDDRTSSSWYYSAGPRKLFESDELILVVDFVDDTVSNVLSTFRARLR